MIYMRTCQPDVAFRGHRRQLLFAVTARTFISSVGDTNSAGELNSGQEPTTA